MFDLTIPEGVQAYLENTSFAASSVVKLTGGLANFTYRITLQKPYVSRSNPDAQPIETLIMKHAKPYVAAWKDVPFAVERQDFESLAFELIPELVGPSTIALLPTLFYRDPENGVMIISDSGPDSQTLKAVLQNGPLPDDVSRDIGSALGVFIGRLHTKTRSPAQGTPASNAKAAFSTNHQARQIVATYTFGRIVPTLTDEPSLISPPLKLSPERLSKLDAFARKAQDRVKTSNDVLNMGDFWTGNMLLTREPTPRVMVVDWEAARPSFIGMDLGQLLAELHLLRVFHPKSRACVDIIVAAFLHAYRSTFLEEGNGTDAGHSLAGVAQDTAARVGTHLVTLTPQVPWGGPELTREVVQEGVDYILHSIDDDEKWLRSSIVGGLWD